MDVFISPGDNIGVLIFRKGGIDIIPTGVHIAAQKTDRLVRREKDIIVIQIKIKAVHQWMGAEILPRKVFILFRKT